MASMGLRRTGILTAAAMTAALLTGTAGGSQAATAASSPSALVRHDGRRLTAPESSVMMTASSYRGSGKVSPTSTRFAAAIPSASAADGRESIIGTDNRVRVNSTTSFPARAVVLIVFYVGSTQARCTGWMMAPDLVVTAGHCVAGGGSFFDLATYAVIPGYSPGVAPYGGCGVVDSFTTAAFLDGDDERYDYGVLKLNCGVGLSTGWLGFFYKTTSFDGAPATVSGYPGDKADLSQWRSEGLVGFSGGRMLYYANDTVGGTSGAPVYRVRPAGTPLCAGYCVMAIHTQGLHGTFPHDTFNHGPRINQEVYTNLVSILSESAWAA